MIAAFILALIVLSGCSSLFNFKYDILPSFSSTIFILHFKVVFSAFFWRCEILDYLCQDRSNLMYMAVVRYGAIIDEIRGKVAGHVFQRCGQSTSLRSQKSVCVSQSSLALQSRNQFTNIALEWRLLSSAQHQSFIDNASSYPTYDRFGNSIILTGYQLFQYINRPLLMAGLSLISTCVAYAAPTGVLSAYMAFNLPVPSVQLIIDVTIPAGLAIIVYLSQVLPNLSVTSSPKATFFKMFDAGTTSPADCTSDFQAFMRSSDLLGKYIWYETWLVDKTTGCQLRLAGAFASM